MILCVHFLRGLCAFQLGHVLCMRASVCVSLLWCQSLIPFVHFWGEGRVPPSSVVCVCVRVHVCACLCVSTLFPPNGPRRDPGIRLLCCFKVVAGWVKRGEGLRQGGVGLREAKENLKRPSSLWSPRRSACEMIRTLIKNDYILIEPFLLTSPSQGKEEAESRGYKMG